MNDDLAELHGEAIEGTLGFSGRMLSFSKSGYRRSYPDHLAVFNSNVCLAAGKIWGGDLDLTRDEEKLLSLASRIGETVFVLYESDGRYGNETDPALDRAVYSATPSGHSRFDHRYVERASDGTVRQRPSPPDRRKRLVLTLGRPRLLRLSQRETVRRVYSTPSGEERTTLLYVGDRSSRTSPLLVLGLFRRNRPEFWRGVELTWYVTRKRHAPRALATVHLRPDNGRTRPYLVVQIHPGLEYRLIFGVSRSRWP